MKESYPESDVDVTVDALWVPASRLDPSTYEDVYVHSRSRAFPLRAALADCPGGGPDARAWASLLAEGFVADRETTVTDIIRNLPVRAAVFAAEYASSVLASDGRTHAGFAGVTLHASGRAEVVSTAGFTLIRVDAKGRPDRWTSRGGADLDVLNEDPAKCFDAWQFEWHAGDTVLLLGRGLPAESTDNGQAMVSESLTGFQGRMRVAFQEAGRSRSATVIRIRTSRNGPSQS